jgi:predicted SprT family Zn-dependent metalloprotease
MSSIKLIANGPNSWDVFPVDSEGFLGQLSLVQIDSEAGTAELEWEVGDPGSFKQEYVEAFQHSVIHAIYELRLHKVKVAISITDYLLLELIERAGFLPGREFGKGEKRSRRYSCDRYDLIRNLAESKMSEFLNTSIWSFGWDSAKRRLGVCKYDEQRISLSRYLIDLHPLEDVRQVILHEVAHAMCGPRVGHGRKWKDTATKLGYRHEKISGEEIGNATARYAGVCPNGHNSYRHRKPKTQLSCSRCSNRFDRRFLITWTER